MRISKLTILAVALSFCFTGAASARTLTKDNGAPVGDNQNSQTAGPNGPVLLQDSQLIEKLQRFDRERIPERVVHARGTGAEGEFVSSGNASDLTKASLFSVAGKATPSICSIFDCSTPQGFTRNSARPTWFRH